MENSNILRALGSYQNQNLIRLFSSRAGKWLDQNEVELLFEDLKKFLYVSYLVETKQASLSQFTLTTELNLIDEIWHQFILMTKDYEEFCLSTFGQYIHHSPAFEDFEVGASFQTNSIDIRGQIEFIAKTWGEDTAIRWFRTWPDREKSGSSFLKRFFRSLCSKNKG